MRYLFLAACAATLLLGCGSTEPTPIKPKPDTVVVVPPEVVTVTAVYPGDGTVLPQTAATYPMARVTFRATATSTKYGDVTTLSYTLDGATATPDMYVPPGTHRVCVTAVSQSSMKDTRCATFTVENAYFSGKILLAGTNTCPSDTRVNIGPPGQEEAVSLQSDCTYSLSSRYSLEDTAIVSVKDASGVMKPFFGRVPKRYFKTMNIVAVPTAWTIQGGSFAGTKISIDLEAAYAPSGDGKLDGFYHRGNFGKGFQYMVGSYPSLVPTAFCRSEITTGTITTSDSAGFWSLMNTFHTQYLGKVVFVPSNQAGVCEGGTGRGMKLVANGSAAASSGGSYTYRDFVSAKYNANITSAFQSAQQNFHEMTHALGFGHTCSWKTNMGTGCVFGNGSNTPTQHDVAYIQLMMAVVETERVLNTRLSLAQAHQGERIAKGLPEQLVDIVEPAP